MDYINFADLRVLVVAIIVTVILNVIGAWKKKSIFPAILLLSYTALLIIHTMFMKSNINLIVDFSGMIISIVSYLIIDEIEIRREKIEQVFEDKYRNK